MTEFQFITLQGAEDVRERAKQRLVRSHIGKLSHRTRRATNKTSDPFRISTTQDMASAATRPSRRVSHLEPMTAIGVQRLDPFDSLAVDSSKLQELLNHPVAQQAVEPVFSISDPYSFHNIYHAYRSGFTDPAFVTSLICAILFSRQGYTFSSEILRYQGEAIRHINRQLKSLESLECTIGAILLLVGVEWRLGSSHVAKVHLKGVQKLLETSASKQIQLSASVRRGIFWQDLNTAIATNSDRTMSRETFPEFQWGRMFDVPWAKLPPGFADMRESLSISVITVLQDLVVLQESSEGIGTQASGILGIHFVDNQQACVEARLQEFLQGSPGHDSLLAGILLAAYLFSYCLFTSVWNGFAMPHRLSSRLIDHLQDAVSCGVSREHEQVILWCIMVGGIFSPIGATRDKYINLVRTECQECTHFPLGPWHEIEAILNRFLWSRSRFGSRGELFWETCVDPGTPPTAERDVSLP